ncbi:hypothetical protein RHSIM_Rhsim11G0076400 [Rhododendron simsii]|uniref:Retrotransposon Copia-like N-terminal domain-containing protein n=1 Tax=Rhododendron simsii TaxID=118357 RepID=A0A834GAN7_RHOSS|nr:hypothetical protein RHSIM_Rhsim11G0076400 [Rhododendron simsii]
MSEELRVDDPFYISPSESPTAVLVSPPLNGDNYGSWLRTITMALRAKNKVGFVDGSIEKPGEDKEKEVSRYNSYSGGGNNSNRKVKYHCDHCDKDGHSTERCYKIIGYHPKHSEFSNLSTKSANKTSLAAVIQEQYDKLLAMLSSGNIHHNSNLAGPINEEDDWTREYPGGALLLSGITDGFDSGRAILFRPLALEACPSFL